MKELHWELARRGSFFRLKPDSMAAVKRLSFKQGSAMFASIVKNSHRVLRKQGFIPSPVKSPDLVVIDPFAILTGKKPLPLPFVRPAAKEKEPIELPPIMICINCRGDGGCTAYVW